MGVGVAEGSEPAGKWGSVWNQWTDEKAHSHYTWNAQGTMSTRYCGDFVESKRTPLSPMSLVLRGKIMGQEEEASLLSGICETLSSGWWH